MEEHSLWTFSRAFQEALRMRDLGPLATVIDDNIEWAVFGPTDMFSFFGQRDGKAEVLKTCREIMSAVSLNRIERERTVLSANQASALLRCTFTLRNTGRNVALRLAHFTQFHQGRVSSFHAMLDTFDLVQQALGEEVQLPALA